MTIVKQVAADVSAADQAWDAEFDIELRQNANGYVPLSLVRTLNKLAKPADPPSNNMGGTSPLPPPFLPHGEKSALKAVNKTKIDWLSFTSSAEVPVLQHLLSVVWPDVTFSRNDRGMPGYPESESVMVDGVQYGLMGYGASHGRNFVSLTGMACKTLTDELLEVLHEAFTMTDETGRSMLDVQLARVDICFDLYRGELTIDHALWSYEKGAFKRPRASATPELKLVGTTKNGANLGRTMYVGKRGGHVMARVYEKGLEVFAKLPEDQRLMSECREMEKTGRTVLDGDDKPEEFKADDWLRLEVEYKRQGKDLLLPVDMLLKRDEYFAGSYPYFAAALGKADGIRPKAIKSDFDVDLLALMANAKRSYGSLIHSLGSLGFKPSDVVEYLSSGRDNEKLVKSGLLARIRREVDRFEAENPDHDIPF